MSTYLGTNDTLANLKYLSNYNGLDIKEHLSKAFLHFKITRIVTRSSLVKGQEQ